MKSLDARALGDRFEICRSVVPDVVDLLPACGECFAAKIGDVISDGESGFEASGPRLRFALKDVEMESAILHVRQKTVALDTTPTTQPSRIFSAEAPPRDSRIVSRGGGWRRSLPRARSCHSHSNRHHPHGSHLDIVTRFSCKRISHTQPGRSAQASAQRGACVQPITPERGVS